MSAITEEIEAIETEVRTCLDTNLPIDSVKIKRLCKLRENRMRELIAQHGELLADRNKRIEIMQVKVRALTLELSTVPESVYKLHPSQREALLEEQDKFSDAAQVFVDLETGDWAESKAAAIEAGIRLILNEIR